MKSIYYYRHGESTKNQKAVIGGQEVDVVGGRASESELTTAGKLHAIAAGKRILYLAQHQIIDPNRLVLAASTAVRAGQTCEIARCEAGIGDVEVVRFEALEELDQGPLWTGHPKKEPLVLSDGTSARYEPFSTRDWGYRVGGTESLRDAADRTAHALEQIAQQTPEDGTAVVIGHGIVLKAVASDITGRNLQGINVDFGAESLLTAAEGGLRVGYLGLPTDKPCAQPSDASWVA